MPSSRSSSRPWLIGILLLLLCGGGLAIWDAARKSVAPEAVETPATTKESQMVGQQASFVVTEGALKKWKLTAARAVYNEAQTDAVLTDVQGEFYNKSGEPVLRFTAPTGNYVSKHNAVELTGGVVAQSVGKAQTSSPKGRLEAPRMVWNAKTDGVTADGGIVLQFPQGKSVAQSCHFNLDFSKVSLRGGVSSSIGI